MKCYVVWIICSFVLSFVVHALTHSNICSSYIIFHATYSIISPHFICACTAFYNEWNSFPFFSYINSLELELTCKMDFYWLWISNDPFKFIAFQPKPFLAQFWIFVIAKKVPKLIDEDGCFFLLLGTLSYLGQCQLLLVVIISL